MFIIGLLWLRTLFVIFIFEFLLNAVTNMKIPQSVTLNLFQGLYSVLNTRIPYLRDSEQIEKFSFHSIFLIFQNDVLFYQM